jgi:hypothetical protein
VQATVKRLVVLCVAASVTLPVAVRAQVIRAAGADTHAQDSALVSRERAMWEALKTRDTTAFARLMGGDVVDVDVSGIKRTTPATTARYVLGCQTISYMLSEPRVVHTVMTATITYTATVEATCWGQKAPSPLYVMTVYMHQADGWLPVAHSETPVAHW